MKHISGILLLLISGFIFSCSKNDKDDNSDTPAQNDIVIASMFPTSGPYSTVVTLTGSGFNTTASQNTVKFNGKNANVQSATSTQLVVIVPEAAGTGFVTVSWGSKAAIGQVFNFIYTVTVSTFCGNGVAGFQDGAPETSQFNSPWDLEIDSQDNLYVADFNNNRIRKITPDGTSSTLAGSGVAGTTDGNGSSAQFYFPAGLGLDNQGNVIVADQQNHLVRKVTPTGEVTTVAGSISGYADGNGTSARFFYPTDAAVDGTGNIYVADQGNERIRKITPSGVVSTFAGNGSSGFVNGNGLSASFHSPVSVIADHENNIIVSEYANSCLRKITPNGEVSTWAGAGSLGYLDGQASTALFDGPWGLGHASDGTIYIADMGNHKIRMLSSLSTVSTIAGSTSGYTNGTGSVAQFSNPTGVAVDHSGNLYIADSNNHVIRKVVVQ